MVPSEIYSVSDAGRLRQGEIVSGAIEYRAHIGDAIDAESVEVE